jgi:hypothetical protein
VLRSRDNRFLFGQNYRIDLPNTLTSDYPYVTTVITMAHLPLSSRAMLRCLPRTTTPLTAARCLSASHIQKRPDVVNPTSSFDSPFKGMGGDQSSKVPDFSHYKGKSGSNTNQLFQYFMVGTMGALTAAGAKGVVEGKKTDIGTCKVYGVPVKAGTA